MAASVGGLISADLELDTLRAELGERGHVEINNFLDADIADQVFHCLNREVAWQLAYRSGDQPAIKTAAELRDLGPEKLAQLLETVHAEARDHYQFCYFRYPMIDAYVNKWSPALMLNGILEAINSSATLEWLRALSGDPAVRKVELQATSYAPGHFLQRHNDSARSGDDRRFALVLNLTREWRSQWGGLLQFLADERVTETFTPAFNSCVIFRVPRDHQVSLVAPFATRPRYALTGWLRAD